MTQASARCSGTAARLAAFPCSRPPLAATYDGTTLRLYVNGTEVDSRAITGGSLIASTGPLRIGGNAVWPEFFQGLIDEVRIYNRALSAAEILADMETPVAPPPETTITASPPAESGSPTATFEFTASTPGSSFACRLDGAAFASCTSPTSYSGLAPGVHTFAVYATDPAGIADPTPASYAWTITVAPPTLTSFTPTAGQVGTTITLTGSNFDGATGVTFNGTPATFTVLSATQVSATVPAGATTGPLAVTTPGGTATSAQPFTVVIPPVLVSIAITPQTPTRAVGETLQFQATGTLTDGSTQDVTDAVAWTSSNVSVASKNANVAIINSRLINTAIADTIPPTS